MGMFRLNEHILSSLLDLKEIKGYIKVNKKYNKTLAKDFFAKFLKIPICFCSDSQKNTEF